MVQAACLSLRKARAAGEARAAAGSPARIPGTRPNPRVTTTKSAEVVQVAQYKAESVFAKAWRRTAGARRVSHGGEGRVSTMTFALLPKRWPAAAAAAHVPSIIDEELMVDLQMCRAGGTGGQQQRWQLRQGRRLAQEQPGPPGSSTQPPPRQADLDQATHSRAGCVAQLQPAAVQGHLCAVRPDAPTLDRGRSKGFRRELLVSHPSQGGFGLLPLQEHVLARRATWGGRPAFGCRPACMGCCPAWVTRVPAGVRLGCPPSPLAATHPDVLLLRSVGCGGLPWRGVPWPGPGATWLAGGSCLCAWSFGAL